MAQKRDGRTQRYGEVIFRNYSHVWIVTSERKRLEKHPVTQKELALGLAILQRQCSKWFVIERSKNRGVPGHLAPMAPDPNAILRHSNPIPEPLEPSHALAGVASATIRKLGCVIRVPLRRSSAMAMAAAP